MSFLHDQKEIFKRRHPQLMKPFWAVKYAFTQKAYCPFCRKLVPMVPGGKPFPRKYAQCTFCHSLERHRFLFYVYSEEILSRRDPIRILHFAPEAMLSKLFLAKSNIDYTCGDIMPSWYKEVPNCLKLDALNIAFPDKSFDYVIANHLVEHIDEARFLSELNRVLKDHGSALISTPVYMSMAKTMENPEYSTPELRKQYYGHPDHLRKYGADAASRFSSVFDVQFVASNGLPPFGDAINSNCFILRKR